METLARMGKITVVVEKKKMNLQKFLGKTESVSTK